MNANDEKLINEQLTILQDTKQATQHAARNQIKILQATIAHIDLTGKEIQTNEYLLANVTKKLREQLVANEHRMSIQEHFLIITTILSDLIRDVNDILEYLVETEYLCPQNFPVHRVNTDPICEIEIYLEIRQYYKNCNIRSMTANRTTWIPLNNPHTWLYSAPTKQNIIIYCKDHGEIKETIENTGRIILENNCKLTTSDTIIKSQKTLHGATLEAYLPEYNISSLYNLKEKTSAE
ncbi:hypothetical protein ALC60_13596 [Trachymyrmex zeteki]|uniref:Envelope fusion protein n=1 Tax=Mycetomoellerius zeteki TaxID=64791 RepID=A0A151WHW1_9HYME|nr:hypothetical protein ALC60_13596 [Trachymyrmex zeteki]